MLPVEQHLGKEHAARATSRSLSHGQATGKQCSIFGYTFDVNPAGSSGFLPRGLPKAGAWLTGTAIGEHDALGGLLGDVVEGIGLLLR